MQIKNRLREMEDDSQRKWWDSWLYRFISNLLHSSRPKMPTSEELNIVFQSVIYMKSLFPEAVDIICKNRFLQILNHYLFISFMRMINHQSILMKLLNYLRVCLMLAIHFME